MTSGGFDVEPDELTAHASHLDGLVDRLNNAVQAADYALSDDAYGLLCAFLPPIVNPTGEQAKDAVSAAAEGMQTTADNVRTTAQAYVDGDEAEAQPFLKQLAGSDDAAGLTGGGSSDYPSGSTPLSPRYGTTMPSEPGEPLEPLQPRIGTTIPDAPSQPTFSPRIGTTVPSEPLEPERPAYRVGTTVPDEPVVNPSSFRIGTVTE
ncbi:type VII secretion target [Amycolatopsis rhabdoformis]|uniref:type VII secretion target n=1 Tax=Amycolatopsis rhabdoformis TaxID=1448059 RepID=UPI003899184F